ncbi:MAG: chemotaxis protein CheD [Clostridia bacterium]|jgi:chemotaxis protein CheD|nr:chemotaxis protein CheD [Clostridia bacterium]MDN5322955.1 chemotaxis protein CheD [Clostridia bacterium]
MDVIKVGMADLAVCKAPQRLMTTGLGSCVGICLYDPITRVGGLAHIMLPDSTQARNNQNKAKYADTAIIETLENMITLSAEKNRIVAKIAGGAQMFNFIGTSSIMRIGERNVEAVKKHLKMHKIPILAEDTGGNFGRTINFNPDNGELHIKTINQGEKIV